MLQQEYKCPTCLIEYTINWEDDIFSYDEADIGVDTSDGLEYDQDDKEPIICPFCGEDSKIL